MELGNYISEQLAMFVRAILLGASLGLVYDLFRTLRRLGGRVWGGVLDGTYCVLAVCSLFLFVMAGDGEMRLFVRRGPSGARCCSSACSAVRCVRCGISGWRFFSPRSGRRRVWEKKGGGGQKNSFLFPADGLQ